MVAAMVKRVSDGLERIDSSNSSTIQNEAASGNKIKPREIVIALICCLVDFGIAQFGLLTLIQKAYSFLAYLAIPVILIPYIIHMIVTRFDNK